MCFFDFLILSLAVHQIMDIHFAEFFLATKQRQQITAQITCSRHQNTVSVPFQMQFVIQLHHAVKNGQKDLLKKQTQSHSHKKRARSKQQIFRKIKPCNLFFLYPDQKINSKLTASLFQYKPHHIIDQPRNDRHDKSGRKSRHHAHHGIHLKQILHIFGKQKRIE